MMGKSDAILHANPVASYVHVEAVLAPQDAQPDPNFASAPLNIGINEAGAREYLSANEWPVGLQDVFIQNLSKIPIRFFICDDSGSMVANDGHKLVNIRGRTSLVPCTRWAELTESLKFHAGIAHAASAATEFRMLNGSEPIRVGVSDSQEEYRFQRLTSVLNGSPGGGTPLCKHIREVTEEIRGMEQELRSANQKACIIIATDGESSDGQIAEALRPLRELPAWVVIRLCTDEDKIVDYWNNVDNELELDMDVLDDLCGEAKEVFAANPWLTYGEPLHRLREFGIPVKEIDLLDEVLLSPDQIKLFCSIIFGGTVESYPHPQIEWSSFSKILKQKIEQTGETWNPVSRLRKPWVDIKRIKHAVSNGGKCTIQ